MNFTLKKYQKCGKLSQFDTINNPDIVFNIEKIRIMTIKKLIHIKKLI